MELFEALVARQLAYSPPVPDRGAGDGRGQRPAGEGDPRHPLRHRGGVRRARGGRRRRRRSRVLTTQRMKIYRETVFKYFSKLFILINWFIYKSVCIHQIYIYILFDLPRTCRTLRHLEPSLVREPRSFACL